jgi:hypothetical protein
MQAEGWSRPGGDASSSCLYSLVEAEQSYLQGASLHVRTASGASSRFPTTQPF